MQRIATRHAVEITLADLRNALRHLRRAPLLASLTILTLGLGIGATTAIFGLVNAMLLDDLPFRDGEQLLFVGHDLTGGRLGRVPLAAAELPGVTHVGALSRTSRPVSWPSPATSTESLHTRMRRGSFRSRSRRRLPVARSRASGLSRLAPSG